MIGCLHHRGPNDAGLLQLPGAALGMTRLSIIDLSDAAHQPMSSPDGAVTIVYNGETYNFESERRRLLADGWQFRSRSDTEVVLNLYLERGAECVERLRGMFAFAIWDTRTGTLLLARDRLGIKPLYYAYANGELLFASEIGALLASRMIPAAVNDDSIRELLAFGSIGQPGTAIRGVHALPPGHLASFSNGELGIQRYWDLPQHDPSTVAMTFEDAVVELRARLREATRLSLVSDVPVGVFLSAGADSAAVLALAAEVSGSVPRTFSIGFTADGQGPWDERPGAEATAKFYGASHESAEIRDEDIAALFDDFVESLDQPSVDGLNTFLVSRLAARDVKVALSGLGGDELFAGYTRAVQAFQQADFLSKPLSRMVVRSTHAGARFVEMSGLAPGIAGRIESRFGLDPARTYAATRRLFDDPLLQRIGAPADALGTIRRADDACLVDPIARVSRLDLTTFVPFQLLRDMDAVSMAHSLEVRFPLLDHELVEWAFRLPAHFKYAGPGGRHAQREGQYTYGDGGTKRILFAAVAPLLPPDLIGRRKQGFKLPIGRWMSTVLRPRMQDMLASAPPAGISRDGWAALRADFAAGRLSDLQAWTLLVLATWERQTTQVPTAA